MAIHAIELNYCPACGHALESRRAFGRWRRACPDCDRIVFRDHRVAAGVLVNGGQSILLVRRLTGHRSGRWSLPAGFVEYDEDPADGARRECLEETGLQVEITGLLDVLRGEDPEQGASIVIVYHARVVGGTLRAGDDAAEAAFFPIDALPPLAFHTVDAAIDRWIALQIA